MDSIKVAMIEESYARDGDRYTLSSTNHAYRRCCAVQQPEKAFRPQQRPGRQTGAAPLLYSS